MSLSSSVRPFVRVGLPVAVAVVLVCLAALNIALIKTWRGELEDGVLWRQSRAGVIAADVAPSAAGARAGIERGDVLVSINGEDIRTPAAALGAVRRAPDARPLSYVLRRGGAVRTVEVVPRPTPGVARGLYYSLALVGILALAIGTSVRLRRPHDQATLHFFWLGVAFFGVLSFSPSGRYDRLDYFFEWADTVARLLLPPLFFHFALVFPERPHSWIRTTAGRRLWPVIYLPALSFGFQRILILVNRAGTAGTLAALERLERFTYAYLAICLLGGLLLMVRALTRLRSVTARRQLRWIVWGSSVGAVPFVTVYVLPLLFGRVPPYAPYTAVLLGCIPLAFASALVRYRLMDIEVLIKKGLAGAAVILVLAAIYSGTLRLVGLILGANNETGSFWALFATLIVALLAPGLRSAIQAGLDRLYYRDRYDYRRALVNFARELNSDLDLDRLSTRLVERIRETLGVDRIALYLRRDDGGYTATATAGVDAVLAPRIDPASALGTRLSAGLMVAVDDPVPARRLTGDDAALWRDAGLFHFVPCVSSEASIGAIAAGRRPRGEALNSEDMTLLAAVAAQAATALENARLYHQLSGKAEEIERLRQFSDSVIESLTDGIVVVDMQDRVLRWNTRMETLFGLPRAAAIGQRFESLFSPAFAEALVSARRESPSGTTLFRVPIEPRRDRTHLLLNAAICPFRTGDADQAGWIIVLEDITARANLEEQLQLSEKMAAIGLLAAGVAHEVNTPLTGISSFTQMLLEHADPADPRTNLLEKIEQQTFRAAKIVSSLLNLARPSGGETGPVDVNATLTDVLALLEHQFRVSKIQVRKQLWREPLVVRGVEYKLQQVFLNLFLNARDAMPKGGWLSVTSSRQQHEVIVEVSDTGVGIPAEHLSRIYDPFFTTKAEGRGIGLGLSVTYGIVQEHGGTLTCESDLTKGTRFRLVLPSMDRRTEVAGGAR